MRDIIFPRLSRAERIKQRRKRVWSELFVSMQLWLAGIITAAAIAIIVVAIVPGCRQFLQLTVSVVPEAGIKSAAAAASMDGFAAVNGLLRTSQDIAVMDSASGDTPKINPGPAKPRMNLPNKAIVVNLPSRTLEFYSGSTLIKEYSVAIGKPSTVTPLGNFTVIYKEVDPAWYPPGKNYAVPSGPDNPLGYRWIGFAPLYGIHGTNAPAYIGAAVSNGCIRMKEADVEEVFEAVSYGMPIRLTYELAKVKLENDGQVTVGIYPDVYGYKNNQVALPEVKNKLAALGWAELVKDDVLQQLIKERAGRQTPIIQLYKLKINDMMAQEWAIPWQDTVLVPAWAIAAALNENIVWNEADQTVSSGPRTVPGVVKGDVLYITAENVQALFGGFRLWHQQENCWEFVVLPLSQRK